MRATAKGQGKPKLLGLVLCTVVVTTLIYVAFVVYGKGSYAGEESSGQVSTVVRTEIPRATQQNTIELKESSKIDGTRVIGRPSYEGGAARTTARTVTLHNDRQGKRTVEHNTAVAAKVPWNEFVATPITERGIVRDRSDKSGPLEPGFHPVLCSNEVVNKLASPRLSTTDFEWCKWAISPTGGKVVVGKSWGSLGSKKDQWRFDNLNCNAVQNGKNPSCDDSWGDIHIEKWRKSILPAYNCDGDRKSRVTCHANDNADKFCTIENAQINFARMKKISRGGHQTPSKQWGKDFLSADCGNTVPEGFPFAHLYSPKVSSAQCDYVHNGTLLMFSHDDIRNLGHTLNDIMNVWVMLWLDGIARDAQAVNMLNIDSFKLGHNFDDQPNTFFLPYTKNLQSILKGKDFGTSTLCVQKLLIQPLPPRFFIWESWFTDMPCSFIGPSSLYQRWNFHVRQSYGLLPRDDSGVLNQRIQVLLVIRNEKTNLWGSSRTSRNYLNTDEIVMYMNHTLSTLSKRHGVPAVLVAKDLSTLDFQAQLRLISESSIMVGMHGAGMASSMHMGVGSKYCCGMIEIYPHGEFSPIRGHGNMARKMGLQYDRIDISQADSKGEGATVPVDPLTQALVKMVNRIVEQPTCVIPSVVYDPYLESIL